MEAIYNAVNAETAEKITTNRDSARRHVVIYLMRDRKIVIEGCEDHKYCFWLSKQRLDDVTVNADILSLNMYGDYDYVAHSVYLFSKLHMTQKDALDGVSIKIEKVRDIEGCRYKSPWGNDSTSKSDGDNGLFMAKGLVEYYNGLKAQCVAAESDSMILNHFNRIEQALDKLTGDNYTDYSRTRPLLDLMWKLDYLKLSDNEKFRFRYERLRSSLEHIYNTHMSSAR